MISCHRPEGRPVYDIHDPTGIHYLFQLRLGLSHLRSHKKRYGFEDTPSDICLCNLGIEDTRHFLLSCPFYTSKREIMVSSVSEILLKITGIIQPIYLPMNWKCIRTVCLKLVLLKIV